MKKVLVCLAVVLLAGCSPGSNQGRLQAVAQQESSRLAAPSEPLSSFGHFELQPMEISAGVSDHRDKVSVAQDLDRKLRARLLPVLQEWSATGNAGGGTLKIQPKVEGLHIVSGGARFWVGAWAGDSAIDMDLTLVDGQTGTVIANPRISRTASAMGGAYSVGATDRNLSNYIVEIAYQYLVDNYKK